MPNSGAKPTTEPMLTIAPVPDSRKRGAAAAAEPRQRVVLSVIEAFDALGRSAATKPPD
ncbi:hypothetical protein ACU4GD_43365 [Cupriavidus basilensis]